MRYMNPFFQIKILNGGIRGIVVAHWTAGQQAERYEFIKIRDHNDTYNIDNKANRLMNK